MTISSQFNEAGSFSEGLAPVKIKANGVEKWGFIDRTGNMIITPAYDWAASFVDGVAKVGVSGSWGYIDRTGKAIGWTPSISNSITEGTGVINESGELTDKAGTVKITLPNGWSVESDLYPGAMLQASNTAKKQFMILLNDDKNQLPVSTTLSEVIDLARANIVQNLRNASIKTIQDLSIHGHPAKQLEVYGEMQDSVSGVIKLNYLITIVDAPEKYYQLITWTLSHLYSGSVNEFKQMANSFTK